MSVEADIHSHEPNPISNPFDKDVNPSIEGSNIRFDAKSIVGYIENILQKTGTIQNTRIKRTPLTTFKSFLKGNIRNNRGGKVTFDSTQSFVNESGQPTNDSEWILDRFFGIAAEPHVLIETKKPYGKKYELVSVELRTKNKDGKNHAPYINLFFDTSSDKMKADVKLKRGSYTYRQSLENALKQTHSSEVKSLIKYLYQVNLRVNNLDNTEINLNNDTQEVARVNDAGQKEAISIISNSVASKILWKAQNE